MTGATGLPTQNGVGGRNGAGDDADDHADLGRQRDHHSSDERDENEVAAVQRTMVSRAISA